MPRALLAPDPRPDNHPLRWPKSECVVEVGEGIKIIHVPALVGGRIIQRRYMKTSRRTPPEADLWYQEILG